MAKSTISGWAKKYSEECRHASKSQPDNPYVKEIHDLNQKITELEKENLFLKELRRSSQNKSIRDLSVHRRKQRHVWPKMAFQAFQHVTKCLLQSFKKQKTREEKHKTFPNLLKQNFTVDVKNKIWCADFACIRLSNGKTRYNCTIIDRYDRSAVASLDSSHIDTKLAIQTLRRAMANEKTGSGLILHTD